MNDEFSRRLWFIGRPSSSPRGQPTHENLFRLPHRQRRREQVLPAMRPFAGRRPRRPARRHRPLDRRPFRCPPSSVPSPAVPVESCSPARRASSSAAAPIATSCCRTRWSRATTPSSSGGRKGCGCATWPASTASSSPAGASPIRSSSREGDRVGIGPFLFTLREGVIHSLDNSRSLRLEARGLEKVVPLGRGQTRKLLDGINLVVQPGEFVSLLGPSGSGKSTLMDCLNGRRRATGGKVLANGEDFYRHFDNFRQSLGYVPQKDIVHNGTHRLPGALLHRPAAAADRHRAGGAARPHRSRS